MAAAEKLLGHRLHPGGLYDPANMPLLHHVNQALRAHTLFRLDVDYMIKDGEVVIVDEFTGRLMPGRRWSDGLHQAVEAKEKVKIERENQTLATITFQNYFRKYKKLAGMTGTAETEAEEFGKIYKLDVIVIPTNREMRRVEEPDLIYRTEAEKYEAIVADILEKQQQGRPCWSAPSRSRSPSGSRRCSSGGASSTSCSTPSTTRRKPRSWRRPGARARSRSRPTWPAAAPTSCSAATPSTWRGSRRSAKKSPRSCRGGEARFVDDEQFVYFFHIDHFYKVPRPDWERIYGYFRRQTEAEHDEVVQIGGLHILGTERHEARRIDNQLRGRAGRQGDPGSSRFYLSLEDDLMRIFGSDRISGLMQRLGMEEGVPIEHGMVTRAIERAQKQVEAQNFSVRKHLLEYDDVMNKQRESIYALRRELLEGQVRIDEDETVDTRAYVMSLAEDLLDDIVDRHIGRETDVEAWDVPAFRQEITRVFGFAQEDFAGIDFGGSTDEIEDATWTRIKAAYQEKEALVGRELLQRVERDLMLQIVDGQWKDHLYSLDHLKEGIGLRGYGQRDPLVEYKRESFELFQAMRARVDEDIVRHLWWLRAVPADQQADAPAHQPSARRSQPLILNEPNEQARMPARAPARQPAPSPFAPRPARTGGDDVVKTIRRDGPRSAATIRARAAAARSTRSATEPRSADEPQTDRMPSRLIPADSCRPFSYEAPRAAPTDVSGR